jgi:hypothetical protein
MIEDRGIILLVVDNTVAAPLSAELSRLEKDLIGDGWSVIRWNSAPRATVDQPLSNTFNSVTNKWDGVVPDPQVDTVKNWIKAQYSANPTRVKSIFLIGHLPVPISGSFVYPDGHYNLSHPMGTDVYYADIQDWQDATNGTGVTAHDKIYDPSGFNFYGITAELEFGRVDMWNMPEFAPLTEVDLLRRYLNKDHNYRHGITQTRQAAAWENNITADAFGTTTMPAETLSSMFGSANVVDCGQAWMATNVNNRAKTESFRMAFLGNYGTYISVKTASVMADDPKINFYWIFGSYTWDWRMNQGNVPGGAPVTMRTPLASPTYGLTSFWNSAYNPSGLTAGQTLGNAARFNLSMGRAGLDFEFLGDPSLRLHVASPVSSVSSVRNANGVQVSWISSPDANLIGYKVYRSLSDNGPFQSISSGFITDTTFQDTSAPAGRVVYMVRAVVTQTTPAGVVPVVSYENPSEGVFGATDDPLPPTPTVATPSISPNGGTFATAQTVTLQSATPGAQIRYTLDGSVPTSASSLYSNAFTLNASATVKAKAFRSGYIDSPLAQASFTINIVAPPTPTVSTPQIVINGEDDGSVPVAINCGTAGAQIRYTLDGSSPTSASLLYTGELILTKTTTVKAKAFRSGYIDSGDASMVIIVTPRAESPIPETPPSQILPAKTAFNPIHGENGSFSIRLDHSDHVRAIVYSRHGQELRVLSDGDLPTGTHSISWDGRDNSNSLVPSGTYVVLIKKSNPERLKLVVIK